MSKNLLQAKYMIENATGNLLGRKVQGIHVKRT
jgi:hypothetical protein